MTPFRIECYIEFTDNNRVSSEVLAWQDFFQPFIPSVGWRIEVQDRAGKFGSFYFNTNIKSVCFNSVYGIVLTAETTQYSELHKNNLLQLLKNEGWAVKEHITDIVKKDIADNITPSSEVLEN